MKPGLRMTGMIITALGMAMLIGTGCGGEDQEAAKRTGTPVEIRTETLRMSQVPVTITAVGTAEPFALATPGTRLMGRVTAVSVSEGDQVSKGKVLARIENQDLLAGRHQAESGVQAARIALTNAESTIQRMRNLYKEHAIPKQKMDEAETGYAGAQAKLAEAEGALRRIEANLSYSAVTAPFTGVITRKYIQPGDMATPGAPLFTMERQDPIKVTVEVNERDLVYVRKGQSVIVEIEGIMPTPATTGAPAPQTSFEGTVEAIVPSANPENRTFRVKVVLPNPNSVIRSGMFARVGFPKEEREGLLVPVTAVVRRGQLEGVFVIADGAARLRWVRLGKAVGDRIEVLSGLDAGTTIARSEVGHMLDGTLVEVRN